VQIENQNGLGALGKIMGYKNVFGVLLFIFNISTLCDK